MIYYAPELFLSWNILEFQNVEKILGARTCGHSIFTVSKIFNIFLIFFLCFFFLKILIQHISVLNQIFLNVR